MDQGIPSDMLKKISYQLGKLDVFVNFYDISKIIGTLTQPSENKKPQII